jgi:hypothetical protein
MEFVQMFMIETNLLVENIRKYFSKISSGSPFSDYIILAFSVFRFLTF